jgi:hypothetical protein
LHQTFNTTTMGMSTNAPLPTFTDSWGIPDLPDLIELPPMDALADDTANCSLVYALENNAMDTAPPVAPAAESAAESVRIASLEMEQRLLCPVLKRIVDQCSSPPTMVGPPSKRPRASISENLGPGKAVVLEKYMCWSPAVPVEIVPMRISASRLSFTVNAKRDNTPVRSVRSCGSITVPLSTSRPSRVASGDTLCGRIHP